MAHDVFLSYSYQDKASADAVCHSLESKGVRCWIAPRDVIPGADWQQSIMDAIAASRAVILIFTSHTNQSENVKKEVSAAFDSTAMVIPFRIEDVTPQGSLKFHLIGVHWLDAYSPPLEEHISHLAKIIQNLPPSGAQGGPPPEPPPPPQPQPGPPPPPSPPPGPTPARWDDVSLDRREGFAFLAAVIPFVPGLYLLWRTTYRADGDKVALVGQGRKAAATLLAVLVIAVLLFAGVHLARGGRPPPLPTDSTSPDSASSAASSAASAQSSSSTASTPPIGWNATSSDGKDRRVKFVNQSSHSIWHIYAWSADASESDAHDAMPEADVIVPNASKSYTIDDGAGHCDYNFKVTRADNAPPLYANNVDVCGINTYTFTE